MTSNIWYIILGSVLAFLGGVVAFFIQWWWNRRSQREVVVTFIREIMRDFQRTSPRIIETYDKSHILWNDLLNQISDSITLYERNKEHSILIKDDKLRAEIWDWFFRLKSIINMCYALNSMVVNNQDSDWAKQEIDENVAKIKEMKNEVDKLIEKLK